MTHETLYLDHAATTPLRPEARAAMEPYLAEVFGNPSSTHSAGREARAALEEARERVARALGARADEIVFTAGGTEADNLAVLGRWRATGGAVVHSAIEHSAVRNAGAQAAREGAELAVVAVDEQGRIDEEALEEALTGAPAVVSVMWGNNEVGVVQPIDRIARRCRDTGVVFHTDAVQAVGHRALSLADTPVDLLALSAHKFGGPRGVGALFVRAGTALDPLVFGGGQERGLRAGTVNVAGAVGLAEALERATADMDAEGRRLSALRDRLEAGLLQAVPGTRVNARDAERLPHISSVAIEDVEPDLLLASLDMEGVMVSTGSACHSGASTPSHVLVGMGAADRTTLRLSLGWSTTSEQVDGALDRLVGVIDRVRAVRA